MHSNFDIYIYIYIYKSGIGQLWPDLDGVGRGPGSGCPKHVYQHGLGLQGCPKVQ